MMELIVNADDFGFTRGVNAGIVRAYQDGILTSATLMANGPAFEDAVQKAQANPGLGVGVHLCLSGGRSVAPAGQIPSLVDDQGNLPNGLFVLLTRLSSGRVPTRQIETEFRAQISRVLNAGIRPTHLDTHKHTHTHPRVMDALGRVANEFKIRCVRKPFEDLWISFGSSRPQLRGNTLQLASAIAVGMTAPLFRQMVRSYGLWTPDYFFGLTATGMLSSERVKSVLKALPDGKSELMCHPGICDEDLLNCSTRLKQERQLELDALTDPGVRQVAKERGIRFIRYEELN